MSNGTRTSNDPSRRDVIAAGAAVLTGVSRMPGLLPHPHAIIN